MHSRSNGVIKCLFLSFDNHFPLNRRLSLLGFIYFLLYLGGEGIQNGFHQAPSLFLFVPLPAGSSRRRQPWFSSWMWMSWTNAGVTIWNDYNNHKSFQWPDVNKSVSCWRWCSSKTNLLVWTQLIFSYQYKEIPHGFQSYSKNQESDWCCTIVTSIKPPDPMFQSSHMDTDHHRTDPCVCSRDSVWQNLRTPLCLMCK